MNGIVDSVVPYQLSPLGQLPREGQTKQPEVGVVSSTIKKGRRADAKRRQELLGSNDAGIDSPLAKDLGADSPQQLTESNGLLGRACIRVCVVRVSQCLFQS